MSKTKLFLFIYFFLVIQFVFSNSDIVFSDSIIQKFPLKVDLYINLQDLNDVEIKNNFFNSKITYELSADSSQLLDLFFEETQSDGLSDLVVLNYYKSLKSKIGIPINFNDSISSVSYHTLYAQFDHNWNVRNYPFDSPELKLQFESVYDSSFIVLDAKIKNFASFSDKLENLKDGFVVKSISNSKDHVSDDNDLLTYSADSRNIIRERLTFFINLDRDGSWLYLKLFLGSFLAFLISWLVFFIPKEDFSSRIELSVGAIFGAVGNRAYVESIMPDVQVFTKADMINNTIIILIIFNIIIFMIQRNKFIQLDFFESNWNSAIYTAYIFIVLNTAILIW